MAATGKPVTAAVHGACISFWLFLVFTLPETSGTRVPLLELSERSAALATVGAQRRCLMRAALHGCTAVR